MNTAQEANKIYDIIALESNKDLSNEQIKLLIEKEVVSIYNKGRRSGHNKAVQLCKNALVGIENANSSSY